MKGKIKNPSNLSTRFDAVGRMKARFAVTMEMQRPYDPADLAEETPGNKKPQPCDQLVLLETLA